MNNPDSPNLTLDPNEPPLAVRPHRCKRGLQYVSAIVLEDTTPPISDSPDEILEFVHERFLLLDLC